jgi:hypothetical protein
MNQIKFKNNLINNKKIINKNLLTRTKIGKNISSTQLPLHASPMIAPEPKK